MVKMVKNIGKFLIAMLVGIGVMAIFPIKASADTGIDDFVTRCYSLALQREPDETGFNEWKTRLTEGEMVGATVVYSFIFSPEYLNQDKTDEEFVNDLYTMFLGRPADRAGYDIWCGLMANEGWSREAVFGGFANSTEFYRLCLGYGITAGYYTSDYEILQVNNVNLFVERLYKTCLGRLGDPEGQKTWVEGLLNGKFTGIECAANFIKSPEYENLDLSDEEYVENLYVGFMGRTYDEGGKKTWLDFLETGTKTRDQVFEGFANSAEFQQICEGYKITCGDYKATDIADLSTRKEPTIPSVGMATITNVRIKNEFVIVSANIPTKVKSEDNFYHLVEIDPISKNFIRDLGKAERNKNVEFELSVKDHLLTCYAIAVAAKENEFYIISEGAYIGNPEEISHLNADFPATISKKGRQGVYYKPDGDCHYFNNFYLDTIVACEDSYDVAYEYKENTYYFFYPSTNGIEYANSTGGDVTIQIMLRNSEKAQDLITPLARSASKPYYAMNMEEPSGREHLEAALSFLAEYWSEPDRHVDNWILGNEVNTYLNPIGWYCAGNISRNDFMTNYSQTFRVLYYAVKSNYKNARVYICADHTWNDRDNDWGAMGFMTTFNTYVKSYNPDIKWNLAYHPYSAVLTNADSWNDDTSQIYRASHSVGADFVSAYNLDVLSGYIKENFGTDCRIILSEAGFSSTGGTNPPVNGGRQQGTDVQAAAYAYLFYKAMFTPNIDACIFHVANEGQPGFNFDINGKEAYYIYRYMDTPQYTEYCNPYLPVINGASSWESIIPGFDGSVLAGMPER